MRNLTLFSTWYTSLHVCVALAHDPRYVPRLVLAATLPERGSLRSSPQPVFLVSSCLLLAMLLYQLLVRSFPLWLLFHQLQVGSSFTSCGSALSFLLSIHRFHGHFVDVQVLVHVLILVAITASHGSCPSPSPGLLCRRAHHQRSGKRTGRDGSRDVARQSSGWSPASSWVGRRWCRESWCRGRRVSLRYHVDVHCGGLDFLCL